MHKDIRTIRLREISRALKSAEQQYWRMEGQFMKAQRKIIRIDEKKCDGCGLCVPACAEGAIQVMDGKAKLVA